MKQDQTSETAVASQNRDSYDGLMLVTEHEKSEWSRLARSAYAADQNDIGHRFSTAASLIRGAKLPIAQFDSLQTAYRSWLISGFTVEAAK